MIFVLLSDVKRICLKIFHVCGRWPNWRHDKNVWVFGNFIVDVNPWADGGWTVWIADYLVSVSTRRERWLQRRSKMPVKSRINVVWCECYNLMHTFTWCQDHCKCDQKLEVSFEVTIWRNYPEIPSMFRSLRIVIRRKRSTKLVTNKMLPLRQIS